MLLYYGILFSHYNFFAKIVFYLFFLQSTLSKTDTFGTGTKCPSYRESNKGSKGSRCPFYRGVSLIEVSIKRESTILLLFIYLFIYCFFIKAIYFNFFMFQDVQCSGFYRRPH